MSFSVNPTNESEVPEWRYKYRQYAKSQRQKMRDFLKKDGCALCGFKHKPLHIHHHWGPPKRHENEGIMWGRRRSLNSLGLMDTAIELSKCVPLCVDCHLKVHRGRSWNKVTKKYNVEDIYRARLSEEVEVVSYAAD